MWVELVEELYEDVEFAEPASEAEVDEVSRRLGQELPADMRAFLPHVPPRRRRPGPAGRPGGRGAAR